MRKSTSNPHSWSEDHLQIHIFVWFSNKYPEYHGLLFHVPNGADGGKKGKKEQMMGVIPGVADMLLFVGTACAIELKRCDGLGTQSKVQKKWQKSWESMGREYRLFNDSQEIKQFITNRIEYYETQIT